MNDAEWDGLPAEWEGTQIIWGDAEDGGPIITAISALTTGVQGTITGTGFGT